MSNEIQLVIQPESGINLLHKRGDGRSVKNRLLTFENWCIDNHINWMQVDLADYRDDLLEELSPNSVRVHLSTLRTRIREVSNDNRFVQFLHRQFHDQGLGFEAAELRVQALIRQLDNMSEPSNSPVSVTKKQDRVDSESLWLNKEQQAYFLDHIGDDKPELLALRDTAIVATMLATGVRAAELCNLKIPDLFQTYEGRAALLVRQGKGNKQRVVLYGDLMEYITTYVTPWLEKSKSIRTNRHEYVFHGFWKDYTVMRDLPLDTSTIRDMIAKFNPYLPWDIKVKPHDFRRTYARMLYMEYNMKIEWIKRQLGHSNVRTTEGYIGDPDVELRVPRRN